MHAEDLLAGEIKYSNLYSKDLAPVPASARSWGTWNYAALWISMSLCIPTYMLASSLIEGGMNWWQAILTIFIGNTVVLIPMILNGHAGAKYGIPFPVFARASFGLADGVGGEQWQRDGRITIHDDRAVQLVGLDLAP